MKNKNNSIELLNSEGPKLIAHKIFDNRYIGLTITLFKMVDQYGETIGTLTKDQIFDFTRGRIDLVNSKKEILNYSKYPGTMKPDLKKLDEFIGIDTTKGTY